MIALTWNAHMNVVKVKENLSYYLLKYVAKSEPAVSLKVTTEPLNSLGIDEPETFS